MSLPPKVFKSARLNFVEAIFILYPQATRDRATVESLKGIFDKLGDDVKQNFVRGRQRTWVNVALSDFSAQGLTPAEISHRFKTMTPDAKAAFAATAEASVPAAKTKVGKRSLKTTTPVSPMAEFIKANFHSPECTQLSNGERFSLLAAKYRASDFAKTLDADLAQQVKVLSRKARFLAFRRQVWDKICALQPSNIGKRHAMLIDAWKTFAAGQVVLAPAKPSRRRQKVVVNPAAETPAAAALPTVTAVTKAKRSAEPKAAKKAPTKVKAAKKTRSDDAPAAAVTRAHPSFHPWREYLQRAMANGEHANLPSPARMKLIAKDFAASAFAKSIDQELHSKVNKLAAQSPQFAALREKSWASLCASYPDDHAKRNATIMATWKSLLASGAVSQ